MVPRLLKDKVIPVAIVSVLTFITLSTSVMAVNKILGSFGQGADQKEKSITEGVKNNSAGVSLPVTAIPTNVPQSNYAAPTQINRIISPTSIPTTNSSSCIVTVFGKQYDVTTLRSTHTGGDVFTCGTDMTAIYQGRHSTRVNLISPYLVITPGGSGVIGPQNGQTSSTQPRSETEYEDD